MQNNQQFTAYIEPKCTLERSRLFELIVDLFHNEIEGRQFNIRHTESKIEQLTTKLKRNETPMTLSALEEVINNINDLNTHIDSPLVSDNIINDGLDVRVDEPQIDVCNDNKNDNNDNHHEELKDVIDTHDDTTNDAINLRPDCHQLALTNVIYHGKEKIASLNIDIQRKNMTILTEFDRMS